MARVRKDFVSGVLAAQISADATIIESSGLAGLPQVLPPDIAVVVLDPLAMTGQPEIVYVVNHGELSITAEVLRGQDGTQKRVHPQASRWAHGPVKSDWDSKRDMQKDFMYVHNQTTAAAEWTVTHGLNGYPSVTVIDSAGTVVEGGIEYLSQNIVRLTFVGLFSGQAFFS